MQERRSAKPFGRGTPVQGRGDGSDGSGSTRLLATSRTRPPAAQESQTADARRRALEGVTHVSNALLEGRGTADVLHLVARWARQLLDASVAWAALAVLAVLATLQVYRSVKEEQVLLEAFPEYADYRLTTARLVPGLF